MRLTNYYLWSFAFSIFFLLLLLGAMVFLDEALPTSLSELMWFEYVLLALATWRLTRLFGKDHITTFLREQFYTVREQDGTMVLDKPASGPRRILADLFGCPWCLSLWSALVVSFFYLLHEIFFYPILLLALSAVAAALHCFVERQNS